MESPQPSNLIPIEQPPAVEAPGENRTLPPASSPGCLETAAGMGAGFVLPLFSLTFYRRAACTRLVNALVFFLLFGLVVTGLHTLSTLRNLVEVGINIQRSFANGEFPEITISGGVAEVSGPQPRILMDQPGGIWLAIDTTGQYTEIDRSRYTQGFLLTRTELVMLNNQGQYQRLPLREMQTVFQTDPILINGPTVISWWSVISLVMIVISLLAFATWYVLIRLGYLLLIGLVFWGIATLVRPNTTFSPVLASGLYAVVPAAYGQFLLSQVDVRFPGLFTLLFLPLWALALAAALSPAQQAAADSASPSDLTASLFAERPLRPWRALIGLPLLIDMALEVIFGWQAWYVTWPLALLTLVALLAVSLPPLLRKPQPVAV